MSESVAIDERAARTPTPFRTFDSDPGPPTVPSPEVAGRTILVAEDDHTYRARSAALPGAIRLPRGRGDERCHVAGAASARIRPIS